MHHLCNLRGSLTLLSLLTVACDGGTPAGPADAAIDAAETAADAGPSCNDPSGPDADGDGVVDRCDVCADGDDALDADGDGVPDACEPSGTFVDGPQHVEPSLFGFGDLGDLDGDGDQDAFVRDGEGIYRVWLNDGSGLFSVGDWSFDPPALSIRDDSHVLIDADRDGDLDVMVGEGRWCELLLNDGSGRFAPSPSFSEDACTPGQVLDFDGDGILDVAAKTPWAVWRGDGAGDFTRIEIDVDVTATRTVYGDLDGDGDADVIVTRRTPATYTNDGAWGFTLNPDGVSFAAAAVPVDFDGDGDLDVVGQPEIGELAVALNDGAGRFGAPITLAFDHASTPTVGDIDRDGHLDLVTVGPLGNRILFGAGDGSVSRSQDVVNPHWTSLPRPRDLDGDGRVDLFYFGSPYQVSLQQADGTFRERRATLLYTFQPGLVTPGDIDGDGDLDLFVPHRQLGSERELSRWWLNDGLGSFSMGPALVPDDRYHAVGDFDGDGRLDTVSSPREGRFVHMQAADGTFTTTRLAIEEPGQTDWPMTGDFNGDGFDDVVLVRFDGAQELVFGSASGLDLDTHTHIEQAYVEGWESIASDDFDGDGDLDLLINDSGWALLRNDGSGAFSLERARVDTVYRNPIATGDLDGDGDADAVIASAMGAQVMLSETDATVFVAAEPAFGGENVQDVVLLDLEGDGDLDAVLIIGHRDGGAGPSEVWTNDGSGHFTDSGQRLEGAENGRGARFGVSGDFDGDGGEDLYISTQGLNRVWLNR